MPIDTVSRDASRVRIRSASIARRIRSAIFAVVGRATPGKSTPSQLSVPVKSIRELTALAKRRPGDLYFASAGTGSGTHLAFELFQSIKDSPKKKCPKCGKSKLRRLIGPGAAIVFKGSGFYITDYRSDSYNKAAKADSSSTASGSTESKPSGDAKPAAAAKKPAGESKGSGKKAKG